MRKVPGTLLCATLLLFCSAGAASGPKGKAGGDQSSEQALNLKPYRTFIQTQNDFLTLPSSPVSAFNNMTIGCPSTATKGCTLRIEVSSVFEDVADENPFETMILTISGGGQPPDPDSSITVDSLPQSNPQTCSFKWMQRSLPAGSSETVEMQFNGTGFAVDRTETIDVYTN